MLYATMSATTLSSYVALVSEQFWRKALPSVSANDASPQWFNEISIAVNRMKQQGAIQQLLVWCVLRCMDGLYIPPVNHRRNGMNMYAGMIEVRNENGSMGVLMLDRDDGYLSYWRNSVWIHQGTTQHNVSFPRSKKAKLPQLCCLGDLVEEDDDDDDQLTAYDVPEIEFDDDVVM